MAIIPVVRGIICQWCGGRRRALRKNIFVCDACDMIKEQP